MNSLFPEKVHRNIYIGSLIGLALGLPLSKFLMSLSQIVMICNWVLEGRLKQRFASLYKNKVALIVCSLLLIHFIGLVYTTDYNYAFKDIRIKLPLLVLPLIIATSVPLTQKTYDIVLKLLVGSVLIGTGVSILVLLGIWPHKVNDMRDISIFISHIRFALIICVSIFISFYFVLKSSSITHKTAWLIIIVWLAVFLIIMESLTGIGVLSIAIVILVIYTALKSKNKLLSYTALFFLLGFIIFSAYYIRSIASEIKQKEFIDFNVADKYTPQGNIYEFDVNSTITENGYLIWAYCSPIELKQEWNKRSSVRIDDSDPYQNKTYLGLIRFLTSKGIRKDSVGVASLTQKEINEIERGVTNVNYPDRSSLRGRIYETLWEMDIYKQTGQANGHSLTQRFEYWKTAISIIKKHLWFGIGTGDINKAFDEEYKMNKSTLAEQWQLRSHNQYLSIAIAFGLVGLCWFLFTLIYPLLKVGKNNYLYIAFFTIAVISFFTEDTLETQAGVTFFAFFNSFFLFALNNKGANRNNNALL